MKVGSVTVTPAYGRDYRTKGEALKAWEEGKDFCIEAIWPPQQVGRYCSARDFTFATEVRIRFNKKKHVVMYRGVA